MCILSEEFCALLTSCAIAKCHVTGTVYLMVYGACFQAVLSNFEHFIRGTAGNCSFMCYTHNTIHIVFAWEW